MSDNVQNLTGTISSVSIPHSGHSPQAKTSDATQQAAQIGSDAPVAPSRNSSGPSLELSSGAKKALASMPDLPPEVDITAVSEIREAISKNEYPISYEKIAEKLLQNFEDLK